MKIERLCKCDHCGEEIKARNDENEVTLNAAKYDYCPSCFNDLCNIITRFKIEI